MSDILAMHHVDHVLAHVLGVIYMVHGKDIRHIRLEDVESELSGRPQS